MAPSGVSSLPCIPRTWYAGCGSKELHARPRPFVLGGTPLVLFRDSTGRAWCLSDACPHRGAPLHRGTVRGDRIVCGYHGWEFDPRGRLQRVPSEPRGEDGTCPSCPAAPLLRAYPVREQGGFVWVLYHPDATYESLKSLALQVPVPVVDELTSPDWFLTYGSFSFDAPWEPVFENALDMSHIHYLHADSFGNPDAPEIRNVQTKMIPNGAECTFTLTNKPVNALWQWSAVPEVHVTARAFLPSVSYIRFELGRGMSFLTYVATIPVDERTTLNRYVLGRTKFPGTFWDPMARRAMDRIFSEDRAMVESLFPKTTFQEKNVRADALQLLWRRAVSQHVHPIDADPFV